MKAVVRLTVTILKRSSIPPDGLIRVFTTCLRPILEYSCEVWHYCIPQYLSDEIESKQRRALRIIYLDLKYREAMVIGSLQSLFERRATICKKRFNKKRTDTFHKLHSLVPPKYDSFILAASRIHNMNLNI